MKNVLIPLTPVASLFCDDTAASAGDVGIGEVLAACIHRYDRLEAADAIGPVSLRRARQGGNRPAITPSIVVCRRFGKDGSANRDAADLPYRQWQYRAGYSPHC